ncbi:hypothetical protein AWB68_06221 [Caballeronia choica]|jgi:hypothetical protein|uniref:Uncharacterized protein n=1 Tax=Caballeronia choica TaxID=326476 RepID=A0A158KKM1_9BURK|nr:hypothetical protein AWB68_06221 [Caballeronia choica]
MTHTASRLPGREKLITGSGMTLGRGFVTGVQTAASGAAPEKENAKNHTLGEGVAGGQATATQN